MNGDPERARRLAAAVFVVVGVSVLGFAAYNLVYVPSIDPADPDRGWAWLTRDPETIDYIRFYFRVQGTWQLAFGLLVLAAALGLRQGRRWAWIGLWSVPLVLLLMAIQAPWTLPALAVPLVLALTALSITRRHVQ